MKKEASLRMALVAGTLVLLAILSFKFHFRTDLTANHSYTVSPYTKECLSKLKSEMTVTWYCSPEFEQLTPAARYIQDFLEEYLTASGGRFSYSIVDPSLMKETATINSLGILPRQTGVPVKDGTTVKDLYSGLLVEYGGQSRVIPFLLDTHTLEYDLTRLVLELETLPAQNAIQLVYGRNVSAEEYQYVEPWITYAGFAVIKPEKPLAKLDPAKSLIVIGSSGLDDTSVAAIRSFLEAGGNAAFFVSGNTVNTKGNWSALPKHDDPLTILLQDYGFVIEPSLLMDVINFRITMPALDNSRYEYINYPFWITALNENMNHSNPVLSGIANIQFFWPSAVQAAPEMAKSIQPLVKTSPSSITMVEPYDTDPFGKQLSLFGDKHHNATSSMLVASREGKSRILVVGDEYMPSSLVEYTGSDTNLDFLVNCTEWISGQDRILELKERQPPIETNDHVDLVPIRVINLILIPAACLIFMSLLAYRGNKRK